MSFISWPNPVRNGLSRGVPFAFFLLILAAAAASSAHAGEKYLAYLVSDLRIPFWDIMKRGIASRANQLGYGLKVYSAENDAKRELEYAISATRGKVDGIILSPTNSSAAVTILKLAKSANIPVVIADIGTDGGEHVSYISSDNHVGAYGLGKILVQTMQARGWIRGSVGVIAIPQKRANGRARTAGFMKALEEAGIKGADIRQQVDFSYQETYAFSKALIDNHPDLRAIWLQGSDRYQAALDAIAHAGKAGQILLISFDAEPEFVGLIQNGTLVGAGMQQPYLIGEESINTMHAHLTGKSVPKSIRVPVLAVSKANVQQLLPTIRRNVLGLESR